MNNTKELELSDLNASKLAFFYASILGGAALEIANLNKKGAKEKLDRYREGVFTILENWVDVE